jgi:hypothetical protein
MTRFTTWRDRTETKALSALAREAIANGFPVQRTRRQPPQDSHRQHAWAASLARARKAAAAKQKRPEHD